jgi:hypothetical protein
VAKYGTFKWGAGIKWGATATGPTGEVTWTFNVDWNGDGALDGANEAAWLTDVKTFRGRKYYTQPSTRGGVSGFEGQERGTATLLFDDPNRRYDPYNTGSPIYPIYPGRLCQLRVTINATGAEYIVFTGWIIDIQPESDQDVVRMELADGWYWLATQRLNMDNTYLNLTLDGAMRQALQEAEYPPVPTWDLKADSQPVRVLSLVDQNAANVMQQLADAGLGTFFFTRQNIPTFYPRSYSGMTTHNLDQSYAHRQIIRGQPWEMIANDVTCIAHRIVKKRKADLWSLGDPIYLATSGTYILKITYPPSVGHSISVKTANSALTGDGTDLSGNFDIQAVYYPARGELTVTNNGAAGYLLELVITGRELSDSPGPYSTSDATSQEVYGRRYFTLDTPYLQSRVYAQAFSNIIDELLKVAHKRPLLMIDQRPATQYAYDLQDKIALTASKLSISETFFVLGIEHAWSSDTGQDVRTTLYLGPTIYNNDTITAETPTEETEIPEETESPPEEEGGGETPPEEETTVDPDGAVAVVAMYNSVYVTDDLGAGSPVWVDKTFPATGINDADTMYYNLDYYFAITDTAIYRCSDLRTMTGSTWTKVYDAATEWTGTAGVLKRIRCSPNDAYTAFVLAYDTTSGNAYCLRTTDRGDTWTQYLIKEAAATVKEYKVTHASGVTANSGGQTVTRQTHTRHGSDANEPWGIAWRAVGSVGNGSQFTQWEPPTPTQINSFGGSNYTTTTMAVVAINSSVTSATVEGWFDEYFGGVEGVAWRDWLGTGSGSMPNDAARTKIAVLSSGAVAVAIETFAFWKAVDVDAPLAFDVAPNGIWLYVSFEDEIWKSENSGESWFVLTSDCGAYDLCVHSQASGVIYVFKPNGELVSFVAGTQGDVLLTETPSNRQHLRLAHGKSTGILWAVTGGLVTKRALGAWTTTSSVNNGRGIRSFNGKFVDLVDDTRPLHTNDGVTFSSKLGTGMTYYQPVSMHLLLTEDNQ